MSDHQRLREAQIGWLASIPFDFALTITFNDLPRPAGQVHRINPGTGARTMIAPGHASFTATAAPMWSGSTLPRVRAYFKALHARVDRRLFGTRFVELSGYHRTLAIGFPACVDLHPHLHAFWRVPPGRRAEFETLFPADRGSSPFRKFLAGVSYKLAEITDLVGWGAYCTKPQHDAAWENMIISTDFSSQAD